MVDGRKVAKGVGWRVLELMGAEGTSLLVALVLAHLLVPEEFGIVAGAAVLVMIARDVLPAGLGEGLICVKDFDAQTYSTGLCLNLALGALLTLLLIALSPVIAWAVQEPRSIGIILGLSPTLLMGALISVFGAMLRRQFRLKGFAVRGLLANLVGASVAVPLALWGAGVWALVVQQNVVSLVSLAVFASALGREAWPTAMPSKAAAWRLLPLSVPIMLSRFVRFAAYRLDVFVVALFAPASMVGAYFFAQRMAMALTQFTSQSVEQIALPVLAIRARNSGDHAKKDAHTLLRWTGAICLPACAMAAALAPQLVAVLAGEGWDAAAMPLVGLAIASGLNALGPAACGQIILASGRARQFAMLGLLTAVLSLGSATAVAGLFHVRFVAIGVACGIFVSLFFWYTAVAGIIRIRAIRLLLSTLPLPLASALSCGLISWFVANHLFDSTWQLGQLLAGGIAGSAVLAMFILPELRLVIEKAAPEIPNET